VSAVPGSLQGERHRVARINVIPGDPLFGRCPRDRIRRTAPSAGVIARDLSEKIEASIVQHCFSCSKGQGHCHLSRDGHEGEVKICKRSGLTINQSKQVAGENYIVVN